ncbi:hypothetical protein [Arthrobacter sp. StoSoilB5]|uniref:hypothetical protein n=1 Tax=Arthrobacter sp. StoSoilB5 TaxID=2830992 RepID=UPI001CC3D12F|nr:hypothetical protein [Arthrobacter sp. StoSoilB5]BCW44899.1 hypothetical protein StoSoilB5_20830 [Arthrobacter sp. StoSoilB5]
MSLNEPEEYATPLLRPWAVRPGDAVELRRCGASIRQGTVETIMPDGSGFWIGAHGPDQRLFVDVHDDELAVWSHQ